MANCAILGRAEAFAAKNSVAASAADGMMMGLGFTAPHRSDHDQGRGDRPDLLDRLAAP